MGDPASQWLSRYPADGCVWTPSKCKESLTSERVCGRMLTCVLSRDATSARRGPLWNACNGSNSVARHPPLDSFDSGPSPTAHNPQLELTTFPRLRASGVALRSSRRWIFATATADHSTRQSCWRSMLPCLSHDSSRTKHRHLATIDAVAGRPLHRLCRLALLWQNLFAPVFFKDLSSAVWAPLRRRPKDEIDDGVTYGGHRWLGRRSVDSFFPPRVCEATML